MCIRDSLEGVLPLGDGVVRIASIYLPNGNPPTTEKYPYKLGWMQLTTAPTPLPL